MDGGDDERPALEMFKLGFEVGLRCASLRAAEREEAFWRRLLKDMPRCVEQSEETSAGSSAEPSAGPTRPRRV